MLETTSLKWYSISSRGGTITWAEKVQKDTEFRYPQRTTYQFILRYTRRVWNYASLKKQHRQTVAWKCYEASSDQTGNKNHVRVQEI